MIKLLGFAGSLRKGSYNRALIRATKTLASADMKIDIFDLRPIPLYNGDLDNENDRPKSVNSFKKAIQEADGLLIACPEYNHGIPGVLKNAIDWASRPAFKSVLAQKPVALMGASPGQSGTTRSQEHLKLVLQACLSFVLPQTGVYVRSAKDKFDSEGRLTDSKTKEVLGDLLDQYSRYIHRLS